MSVVRIGLAKRARGLSRSACQQYWRNEHAHVFAQLPGLLSYVQNHAVLDDDGEPVLGETGFDIFSEVEFADETTLEVAGATRYYREVILADETKLLDASDRTFLMTNRRVLKGALQAGLFKLALFLRRTAISQERAAPPDDWLSDAARCAARSVAVLANVVDRVGGPRLLPVEVVLQQYFYRLDDARQGYEGTRDWLAVRSREQMTIVAAVIAREFEVVPRRLTGRCAEVTS
jgi:hypothetical protein